MTQVENISPDSMTTYLLTKYPSPEEAIKEAREMMQTFKVCKSQKIFWCEVVYKLEHL